ncbi:ribosomal-protein-alanine acetyltransferase [Escherichia coli]|nr:ribosomal-protein-alanine acetyltransferase [Escherichia coli]STN76020.1 ribosomal-protein-alanine acetyltransferase [Escherichia coli]
MFGYRSNVPKVRLTTDRLVVRLVHDRDAWRLADYYAENRHFLKPWEPVRDESHCYPSGWQARLGMINEFHKQGSAFYFGLFDPDEKEIIGVANFPMLFVALFMPAISVIRLGKNGRAKDSCLKP